MTLLSQRLNTRIEAGAVRRVVHPSRIKIVLSSGAMIQEFPSERIRHTFDVSHGVRSQEDYMAVLGAFYAVMGTPYDGLLFRDWADYQAARTNTAVEALGGGVYQFQRAYTFGAVTYLRKISRPSNDGALAVYNAGGSTLVPTVNYSTGTFTVASGTPAAWSGTFDVPVTFSSNEWSAALEVHTQNLHLVNQPIELEEVFE